MPAFQDLTNSVYGRLTVVERVYKENNNRTFWKCVCICGNETVVDSTKLKSGHTKSCGCFRVDQLFIDLRGKVFTRLKVIAHDKSRKDYTYWICECSCGKTKSIRGQALLDGKTKSCGCLHKDNYYHFDKGVSSANTLFRVYKEGAKSRGHVFELTYDYFLFLTKQNCHYCGCIPSNYKTGPTMNGGYVYNGIDRKDNSIGYTVENSVPCCIVCNRAKLAMQYELFILWLEQLVTHRIGLLRDREVINYAEIYDISRLSESASV